MARGGQRTPADPAPVSGPGALARRTDGKQPIRVASGGSYGQRKALAEQQAAAPLPAPGPGGASPSRSAPPGPLADLAQGAFGPSQRPEESILAGTGMATERLLPPDPDAILRIMYAKFPHPDIARLLT